MPSSKTHLVIGGITGATVNLLIQMNKKVADPESEFDWGEMLLCTGVGAAAGLVPDLIEPADSPHHRAFFHSVAAAALVAYAVSGKHSAQWLPITRLLALVAGTAYISHLVADATTPKCIRLI